MIVPSHMEKSFSFDAAMPEIVEEETQEGYCEGKPLANTITHSPPNFYGTFSSQVHQHHESTSTSASESAGSSPTTTASMADDSSVTEMSPESSPESPMARAALPALSVGQIQPQNSDEQRPASQTNQFFDMQRPLTPGKKPKNLKNLAVKTAAFTGVARGASTSVLPTSTTLNTLIPKEQSDRLFARPPSPAKRRPNNLSLTITTPSQNKSFMSGVSSVLPPTPSLMRPSLRHFQSSPSLPAFPKNTLNSAPPLPSISRPMIERALSEHLGKTDEDEQNYDIPQSREEKPDAYPEGPICVYDPHVDLYLEPTAIQASAYDVILNVASEVTNPFLSRSGRSEPTSDIRLDGGGGIQYAPKRERNSSQSSNTTVLKAVPEAPSPTTPKASPRSEAFQLPVFSIGQDPEYIHIPWEHNTDIVPDLLRLVKLIDDRVKRGKRVLVHCQCGVSRSATLVVAYCMYKHPEMSVQEAYDTIKRRSKWIGPNMNLIMQLQEFKSNLTGVPRRNLGLRSLTPIESSGSWNEWRRPDLSQSVRLDPQMPKTAPLPPPAGPSETLTIPDDTTGIVPGPSSAPSGLSWPINGSSERSAAESEKERSARALSVPHQAAPPIDLVAEHPVPVSPKQKKRPQSLRFDNNDSQKINAEAVGPQLSPRSEEFAMTALQPPPEMAPEDRFGLMSPSASTFQHTPLDRDVLLGSLGMGTTFHAEPLRARPQNFSIPYRRSDAASHCTKKSEVVQRTAVPTNRTDDQVETMVTATSDLDALMSPRAAEFTTNPFSPTSESIQQPPTFATALSDDDPRSPPQRGAVPITRNISDSL